jgi:hypothetical protein
MFIIHDIGTTTINMNNYIEHVFLYGGSRVNIIIEQLRTKLMLPKLKPTPCNMWMENQIIQQNQ